jgi:hypothetical protein
VRHVCPTCQEHGTPCYFALKQRSGLFIDKSSSSNGFRAKLTETEWRLLGVDLDWPPPRDPHSCPADVFVRNQDNWPDPREASELAKELQWLSLIGTEELSE